MLRMGTSMPLKQRILSDGHLSNEDGANGLMSNLGNWTKNLFGH